MCGIAGIATLGGAPAPWYGQLKSMCTTLVHRGPDDEGLDIRDGVAMGMRRLSIIDIEGGAQPIFNEDRTIRVVYNGEIYNFKELRKDLVAKGHRFRTATDTEVLVHAYEEYGNKFIDRLNGMFAFALHDLSEKRLLLVRDHMGIKPLYYAVTGGYIVWGSEIKALLASGVVKRELCVDALAEFLSWEYVPGKRTLLKGVGRVGPGSMVEIDLDRASVVEKVYWDIPLSGKSAAGSLGEWVEEVEEVVQESTAAQMISDVPVGAFLSGGVDSSLMVACMGRAKTFSIGFEDPSYNELPWARRVASHLDVEHREEVICPDVELLFEKLMGFLDDPIGDFSIFPTYLVAKHAKKDVTVALSGDGADELFGGYETYVADALARRYPLLSNALGSPSMQGVAGFLKPRPEKKGLVNKAKRFVEGLGYPPGFSHARWRIFMGASLRRRLFTEEAFSQVYTPPGSHILALFDSARHLSPLAQSLYVDLRSYLVDNCLVKTDRMSMAVSLEARVPYLDKRLVELAFRIPDRFKVARGRTKILLKKVAARRVPAACIYRPKEGFSIPVKNWLAGPLRPLMEELLEKERIGKDGLFRVGIVEQLKREHLKNIANHSHILWSLMVFQAWKKRWLEA